MLSSSFKISSSNHHTVLFSNLISSLMFPILSPSPSAMLIPKSISISFSPSSTTTPCPCSNLRLQLHPYKNQPSFNGNIQYTSTNISLKHSTKLIIHCSSTNPNNLVNFNDSKITSLNHEGLVFGLGNQNSWDNSAIGSPVVKRFLSDEEERWYMWYHGTSYPFHDQKDLLKKSKDIVGLAVSSNGIHWERGNGVVQSASDVGMVLNVSDDWWGLDTHSIRPAEVVVMSSSKIRGSSVVYWLYYTGFSKSEEALMLTKLVNEKSSLFDDQVKVVVVDDGHVRVCKSLPGLAMSQDGRHWARIEGEHHSGALFDIGSVDEWDSTYISSPQVVFHQTGDLRMYYHSYDVKNSHFCIGVARSRDGMNWIKLGKVLGAGEVGCFDELGVMNACVVKSKNDGNYVMAYEAVNAGGGRSVGLAISADGLKDWKRVGEGPVLEAADGESWDNGGVGSPCLVHMEGEVSEWRLYYRGFGLDGKSGIGMAVSGNASRIGKFQRWKGF